MQSQQVLKQQEMKQQQEVQKIQMETQAKMEYRQADIAFEIEKMKNEAMLKSQLMDKEFQLNVCLLYTSPSPRDRTISRMPSCA